MVDEDRDFLSDKLLNPQACADKLDALYSVDRISILAHLLVGLVYAVFQAQNNQLIPVSIWYSSVVVFFIFRWFLVKDFDKREASVDVKGRWLHRFRLSTWTLGLLFGSIVLFFHPSDDAARQVFTVLVLAGLAACALTLMSADYISYTGYAICLLSPVVIYAIFCPSSYE